MTDRHGTPPVPPPSAPVRSVPPVPPGSTALREFCHAVADVLALPAPGVRSGMSRVQLTDEVACLRLSRDRARLVLSAVRRILADREIGDHDVMAFVVSLREQLADYPPDGYHHAGRPS